MAATSLVGEEGPDLSDGSLPRLFLDLFAKTSDSPVLYEDETGWHSAGEIEELSRRAAAGYAAAGLERGDRLVLSARSSVGFVVAHLAALRLGLVLVPANTGYTPRELAHIAADSKARGVVSDEPARKEVLAGATRGEVASFAIERGSLVVPGKPEAVALDDLEADDPAMIVYTSGTTGQPKGALLTHRNLLANALSVAASWQIGPDDRLVLPLPLFHVHGLCVGVQSSLAAGASVVLRSGFEPADVGRAIEDHEATLLFGVPTMYARLAEIGALSSLRLAVSGSAPLPATLHRRIAEAHGQQILERYGMSEALMIATNPYEGERRPGTVGGPFPGVEIALGEPGPDGAGEVLVRSPSLFAGYFGRPEATAAAFHEDGWFSTGDLGVIEKGGYLRLVGRKTELIITGGYNVYPREVEEVLRRHPAVADAAVVGEPDALWGERVVAFVEADSALDTESLLALAARELAGYKLPRRVEVVSSLPRNALGKVVKAELKTDGG